MSDRPPEHDADADPMRVVRLLWEPLPPPARGRKHSIALPDIVAAGIRIADARGIDALTMRQVAAELGVGTMSLYTYLLGKAELVELMVDRALGELGRPGPDIGWRERVGFLATASWELYHRHPWILQTNLWRFTLGPHALDKAEAMYTALEGWGLPPARVPLAAGMIESYVQGSARNAVIERQTEQATGESYEGYFNARIGFWENYFDGTRYPAHTRIWNAGGFDAPESPFPYGLERLLDALELQRGVDRADGPVARAEDGCQEG